MIFLSILCALLIEQVRPLARDNAIHLALRAWVRWVQRNFDAGKPGHGALVAGLSVGVPAGLAALIGFLLSWGLGWVASLVWSVILLYVTLGFRQFSHFFTDIRDALEQGDDDKARALLATWQQVETADVPRTQLVRHLIEYSVLAAHRHVFGVLLWYAVLAAMGFGPAGAVLYRVSEFVARFWAARRDDPRQIASGSLVGVCRRLWWLVDWVPARLTALGLAVVGSFQDAAEQWRRHAERHPDDNDGLILAATAGSLQIRLGGLGLVPRLPGGSFGQATEPAGGRSTLGEADGRDPVLAHLPQVVGLVWRMVVMWMLVLALMTLARWLG